MTYSGHVGGTTSLYLLTRCREIPSGRPFVPRGFQRTQDLPDLVTAQFYTTCFTGVVVRYVCTTGSNVCGHNRGVYDLAPA
jgi:hypothetical protein